MDTKHLIFILIILILIVIIMQYLRMKHIEQNLYYENGIKCIEESEEEIPPEPIPPPVNVARVSAVQVDELGFFQDVTFEFKDEEDIPVPITTNEDIRIDVFIDGLLIETLTGVLNNNFSTFSTTQTLPNQSLLDWINIDGPMIDGAVIQFRTSSYVSFNGAINPPSIRFDVYVGGPTGDQYLDESTNIDNTDFQCTSLSLEIVSAIGTPGTEDGFATAVSGGFIATYGAAPIQMFRQYTVTYNNGLTAIVDISGTTSNQQMWFAYHIPRDEILLAKASPANISTTNGSNANSRWDSWSTEGANITWTFDQPVAMLSAFYGDIDGSAAGAVDAITPEANAWWQVLGGTTGIGIATNPSGIFRYRPPGGDNNNSMYLFWTNPLTTISFRFNEVFALIFSTPNLLCQLPPSATSEP